MAEKGLVQNLRQVRKNVRTLHRYRSGSAAEKDFHGERLKLGRNFVVDQTRSARFFSPSKFTGYEGNDRTHLAKLNVRDGRVTDRCLDSLIGERIRFGDGRYKRLEREFQAYCQAVAITPVRRQRTFWLLPPMS